MEVNSILLLYTDAIIERKDGKGQNFGLNRLKNLIKQNKHKSANEILDVILNEANVFGKSKKWEDDATIIVIKKDG
jgi:sigma-B regulation protein RsbU (phosphoserine phosphatase)